MLGLAHERAVLHFRDQLKTPPGDADIGMVSSVWEVVVEDGLDRFRGAGTEPFLADVDPLIGVGGEEVDAVLTKGPITFS